MALKDRISEDMKAAMRARDSQRLESIRFLRAAIQRREVDDRVTLGDDGVVSVIQKQLKQCQDAITQFTEGDRDDLADKERVYQDILQSYMPRQLDEQEIDQMVASAMVDTGADNLRDMSKVMAVLKEKLKGKADMSSVSRKVKAQLQG